MRPSYEKKQAIQLKLNPNFAGCKICTSKSIQFVIECFQRNHMLTQKEERKISSTTLYAYLEQVRLHETAVAEKEDGDL